MLLVCCVDIVVALACAILTTCNVSNSAAMDLEKVGGSLIL